MSGRLLENLEGMPDGFDGGFLVDLVCEFLSLPVVLDAACVHCLYKLGGELPVLLL